MFDTLIELYDNNTYDNLLAATQLKPRRMIIVGNRSMNSDDIKSRAGRFYALRNQRIEVQVLKTEDNSIDAHVALLARVFDEYPHSALNINGGGDLMLVAAGIMIERSNVPVFHYNNRTGEITNVRGCKGLVGKIAPIKLTVAQVLAIAGASIIKSGRVSASELSAETERDVYSVWEILCANRNAWGKNTGYFQALEMPSSKLKANAPAKITTAPYNQAQCNIAIMKALENKGIISDFHVLDERVSFKYKNPLIAHCLRDTGIWLELITYYEALAIRCFDDIRLCGIIDWNTHEGKIPSTSNEIDLIMTKGTDSYFVSCKSGNISADSLNEIYTLAHRFGGENPHPIIVTAHDFAKVSPGLNKRAKDMNVAVLGGKNIVRGTLARQFKQIIATDEE